MHRVCSCPNAWCHSNVSSFQSDPIQSCTSPIRKARPQSSLPPFAVIALWHRFPPLHFQRDPSIDWQFSFGHLCVDFFHLVHHRLLGCSEARVLRGSFVQQVIAQGHFCSTQEVLHFRRVGLGRTLPKLVARNISQCQRFWALRTGREFRASTVARAHNHTHLGEIIRC